jgi:hypothetical protein
LQTVLIRDWEGELLKQAKIANSFNSRLGECVTVAG